MTLTAGALVGTQKTFQDPHVVPSHSLPMSATFGAVILPLLPPGTMRGQLMCVQT